MTHQQNNTIRHTSDHISKRIPLAIDHNMRREITLSTVKKNGLILEYIKNQTVDICMAAVRQNGLALKYVNEQTYGICLTAIRQNGMALEYVRNQTPDICFIAVTNDPRAVKFLHRPQNFILEANSQGICVTFHRPQI